MAPRANLYGVVTSEAVKENEKYFTRHLYLRGILFRICKPRCDRQTRMDGGAENAGLENAGVAKMQGWKTRDWKTRHQTAGVENAGLENAGV